MDADNAQAGPPAAFAVCTACHTVSADGSNGMGPNLRGVIGRRAGTAKGFSYSPAMNNAGIIWTAEQLDAFIASPGRAIPGNFMALPGIQDPAKREAIIDYLISLGQ